MHRLLAQIQDLGRNSKATVLLQGETGTGKEFTARVLHQLTLGPTRPFIAVNCTAIPHHLFESELFGYERGAFTGANQRKLGLLEQAEGGTLFLDEIGDLDLALQAKLLRVLQERSFRRLGGTEDITSEFRLIAASNRDLKKAVASGDFREDLYFRLSVIVLHLPPLRDRVQDILPLCRQAIVKYAREFDKEVLDIEPEAETLLQRYSYPGNIRELNNIIERAMIFCRKTVTADYLRAQLTDTSKPVDLAVADDGRHILRIEMPLGKARLSAIEASIVREAVRLAGNKSDAARYLGITRFALDRRLKRFASCDQKTE